MKENFLSDDVASITFGHGHEGEVLKTHVILAKEVAFVNLPAKEVDWEHVTYFLKKNGKERDDVKHLFLTGYHPHEAYNVKKFLKVFKNATVHVHKNAVNLVKHPGKELKKNHYKLTRSDLLTFAIKTDPFEGMQPLSKKVAFFKDGAIFNLGDTSIHVISFPGPCDSYSMFFESKNRVLFTGPAPLIYEEKYWSYMIDLKGSLNQYLKILAFMRKAKINKLAPSMSLDLKNRKEIDYLLDMIKENIKLTNNSILDVFEIIPKASSEEILEQVKEIMSWEWGHPFKEYIPETNLLAHLRYLEKMGKLKQVEDKWVIQE